MRGRTNKPALVYNTLMWAKYVRKKKTKSASVGNDVNGCECRMWNSREKHRLAITKSIAYLCLSIALLMKCLMSYFPSKRSTWILQINHGAKVAPVWKMMPYLLGKFIFLRAIKVER